MGSCLRCRGASELIGRHEILFSPFDCEQIRYDLPRHGQRGAIAIASLHLFFIDQGQVVVHPGRRLRSFDQHVLDMFVALLGNGRTHHLVGRTLLGPAQSAVTDGLLDRPKARNITDLQAPCQRRNRTDPGNRSEALEPLGQQRVTLQGTHQRIVEPLCAYDVLAAQLQQWPDARTDLLVLLHQLGKVADLVQPPLVEAHTGLHQQARDPVLHLND